MDQFSHDAEAYASFDDPNPRGGSRDSLMLSAQLRLPVASAPVTVRVRNLSPGGLMAEYPGKVAIDDAVEVEVRGIGWIAGRIAWVAEGRLGISFNSVIDPMLARKPIAVVPKPPRMPKSGRAVL